MNAYEAEGGLREYLKSKWAVADDDRLKQHIHSIPSGISFAVLAITKDTCGNDCPAGYTAEKVDEGHWKVQGHWMHEDGAVVPDSAIAHDLTWLLRCRQVKLSCIQTSS